MCKKMTITDKITITNEDNMELMARYPDKHFELAMVISIGSQQLFVITGDWK